MQARQITQKLINTFHSQIEKHLFGNQDHATLDNLNNLSNKYGDLTMVIVDDIVYMYQNNTNFKKENNEILWVNDQGLAFCFTASGIKSFPTRWTAIPDIKSTEFLSFKNSNVPRMSKIKQCLQELYETSPITFEKIFLEEDKTKEFRL